MNTDPTKPSGWEQHEREQVLHVAAHTTPEQRLMWVDEMLTALGKDRVEAHRRRQEQADLEDLRRREIDSPTSR